VAFSRQFTWVLVNRDETPEITKRYRVTAHPTLLFLNPKDEMIHRFSGYKLPAELLAEFFEAAGRWSQYRAGQPWDVKVPRPAGIITGKKVVRIPAPFPGPSSGLTVYGDDLFVAERGKLHRLDGKTGAVKKTIAVPESVLDLTTDGELLYALESGWTAGKPIHVIDPETDRIVRTIVTEANLEKKGFGAKGIAWRDGKLWVLEGMKGRLHQVDPKTGEILQTVSGKATWLSGLAWDGTRFVTGSRDAVVFLDPRSGAVSLSVPVQYRLRSVAVTGDDVLLMEQPIFGYDRKHERIQVWPEKNFIYRVSGLRDIPGSGEKK